MGEIELSEEFGWVILTAAWVAFQVILTGFGVGFVRRKFFTKEFFAREFPELKGAIPEGGYPDMGSGKYSQRLSLADWTTFNNYQRSHYNFVEGATTIVTLILLCGLFYPRFASVLGVVYSIGRFLYAQGYRTSGSRGRIVGVLLVDLSLMALFCTTVYAGGRFLNLSSFSFAGGINGLTKTFGKL